MTNPQIERFQKILDIVLQSDVNIIDVDKLKEYIKFCIVNDLGEKLLNTEYHHILIKAKTLPFQEYSDLKEHSWNGTYLSYYNHYYSHFLLTQAINEYAINYSFCLMNSCNYKKISKEDLIPEEEYTKIKEKAYKQYSKPFTKTYIDENGNINTSESSIAKESSKKYSETINKEFLKNGEFTTLAKEQGKKLSETINKEFMKDGKLTTIAKETAKKASETKTKEFMKDGKLTTIAKETAKKRNITMNEEFINENGELTTKVKEYGKKRSRYNDYISKRYNIYDKDDNIIFKDVSKKDVSKKDISENYSQSLLKSSKDKRMGDRKSSKTNLIKNNKGYLIGCYAIEVPSFKERDNK